MAHSAGHFDAVMILRKWSSISTKSSFTTMKCSRSLMPNFVGGREIRSKPLIGLINLVAELSELKGKILLASDSKAESETSLQEANSDIACVTALRNADMEERLFQISESHSAQKLMTNAINILTKVLHRFCHDREGVLGETSVKGMNPAPHIHEHLRYTIMATALRTPSRITTSRLSTLR